MAIHGFGGNIKFRECLRRQASMDKNCSQALPAERLVHGHLPDAGVCGWKRLPQSDPLAPPCTLLPMTALADPFSRVHPLFWPVLWVSLRAFVAWTGKLIEDGHGYAGLSIEITWYGWIRVVHLDLSHM
jgi:hypothetical protein